MVRYLGVAAVLAVAIGCTGDAKPSNDSSTTPAATSNSTPAKNASADTLTPVSFTITSELKWATGWGNAIKGIVSELPGVASCDFDSDTKIVSVKADKDFDPELAIKALGESKYVAEKNAD